MNEVRLPPHNIEAERSVIGALILAPEAEAWDSIDGVIAETDFYHNAHRLFFRAIESLARAHKRYDAVTVAEWLENTGELSETGGMPYLVELADYTPSAANLSAYAEIVRERSVLRHLITVSMRTGDAAYAPDGRNVADILDAAERDILSIRQITTSNEKPYTTADALFPSVIENMHHRKATGGLAGIATGYTDIDNRLGGLMRSDLIIVAGRPAMGKTTFAMNIATHISKTEPVFVVSAEMPEEQLALRMLSAESFVSLKQLREATYSEQDGRRADEAATRLMHNRMIIDTMARTPAEIRAKARRCAREHGRLGALVVDYLQLLSIAGYSENRVGEISQISRELKALAKELDVPVIALSQLNRSLESRPDKRPLMSDLRESGAIEQDADIIICIYRDEVYNEDSPDKGTAEILIRKFRNGEPGMIRMRFNGAHSRFDSYTDRYAGYGV